jgi:hypothetical protein
LLGPCHIQNGLKQLTKNLCKHGQSIGYHQLLLGRRIGRSGVKTDTMNSFLPLIFKRLPPLLKGFTEKNSIRHEKTLAAITILMYGYG